MLGYNKDVIRVTTDGFKFVVLCKVTGKELASGTSFDACIKCLNV